MGLTVMAIRWASLVVMLINGQGMTANVQTIYPEQAGAGELVSIQPAEAKQACATVTGLSRFKVYFGSVAAASVRCDRNSTGRTFINVTVPRAAPGPQLLRVVSPTESLNTVEGRWFHVLPEEVDLLVMPRGVRTNLFDLGEFLRSSRSSLQPPTRLTGLEYRRQLAPAINEINSLRLRLPILIPLVPQLPFPKTPTDLRFSQLFLPVTPGRPALPWFRTMPLQRSPALRAPTHFAQPSSVTGTTIAPTQPIYKLEEYGTADFGNGDNQVCGRRFYTLKQTALSPVRARIQGLLLQTLRARQQEIVLAPSTFGLPPADTTPESGPVRHLSPYERMEQTFMGLKTIGIFEKTSGSWTRAQTLYEPAPDYSNVVVFMLDSLDENGIDAVPTAVQTLDGVNYLSRGHGTWVEHLINGEQHGVAPGVTLKRIPACGPSRCHLETLIKAICDAGRISSQENKRVIVNASLSSPYSNPILSGALADATRYGVAVVTAYGNNDNCQNLKGTVYTNLDYCNAFPADAKATETHRNTLYSVGGSQQNGRVVQWFQRGSRYYDIDRSVRTRPDIYAPSFFWFDDPLPDAQGWQEAEMKPADTALFTTAAVQGARRPHKGTSFAAPLVTGALALWAARHPTCPWPSLEGLMTLPDSKLNILHIPTLLRKGC